MAATQHNPQLLAVNVKPLWVHKGMSLGKTKSLFDFEESTKLHCPRRVYTLEYIAAAMGNRV